MKTINRRDCIVLAAAHLALGIQAQARPTQAAAAASPKHRILVLGDSLSAEYGLRRGSGWVALLERKLTAEKISASVVNASISGETTSGGRARLPALLQAHQPTLLMIELGANDALRGLPLTLTQDNLSAMTLAAQHMGARVLLLGLQVPPNYGRDYAERFARLFANVASSHKAALVPFFLKGVADVPDSLKWFQNDRIHPTEAAHPLILATVWPALQKALQ